MGPSPHRGGVAPASGRPPLPQGPPEAGATPPRPALYWIVVLLLVLPSAHAQRTDLDRIKSDITRLRQRLEEVRRQTLSAERELEAVDLELRLRTRELDLAADAEARLVEQQKATEAQIAELLPRIARQKADLRKRLVILYRVGGLSYIRMLLALDDEKNPIEAMSMLSYLVTRDSRLVSRFQLNRRQLAVREEQLAAKQKELQQSRAVVEQRRRAVAIAYERQRRTVARLRVEETGAEQQLAALEEKARRLQRLVDVLSKQARGEAVALDIRTVQGALPWPVEGEVVERFGRQRNPKFATFTVNNGLKIEALPGTPVRSVFQGTVLFSQWFKGYGNLIILDHGNRVFSLYGNLKLPTVTAGDHIAAGQTIAGVGESEDASSGHLYFEIRQDNRPEDPQSWLR
jgi:septal ring factor EnvC (AmiA/AmiB activator)